MILSTIGRWGLVVVLLATAGTKLGAWLFSWGEGGGLGIPYGVIAVAELVAAAVLAFAGPSARRNVAGLVASAAAGAGLVALVLLLFGGEFVACRCLGAWRMTASQELTALGMLLLLGGLALHGGPSRQGA